MSSPIRAGEKSKTVCVLCRQRKVGCDRTLPSCGFCAKNGSKCQYITREKRPGLRAGYVSALEQRLVELEKRVITLEGDRSASTPRGNVIVASPKAVQTPIPTDNPTLSSIDAVIERDSTQENESQSQSQAEDQTQTSHDDDVDQDLQICYYDPMSMSDGTPGFPSPSTSSAVSMIINPLSPPMVNKLCDDWFQRYHPWFPILHQPSLLEALHSSSNIENSAHGLVITAIVAVTITHCQTYPATTEERHQWSTLLRDKVVMEAMSQLSLQSIQSLLILSNMDYGLGKSSQFWNLIALCKRMSLHLGLRDLVTTHGDNFNKLSSIPPRVIPLPNTIIDREERVRAYWMTETLDNISTLGAGWNIGISQPEITAVLPCSDSIWAFPEHFINVWSFGEFNFSSAFSLCIILASSELWHVHRILQKSFDLTVHEQKLQCQAETQELDERLTSWRAEFVAAVYRLINTEFAQEERAEMDPNIVLTNCILDCAVIVLFQRMAPVPQGIENSYDPWIYATNKCIYAADDLAAKIRLTNEEELAVCNPHLIFSFFVAARFYLVYAKAVEAEIPRNYHVLAHAMRIAAKRWALARRYSTILQTAAAEHRTQVIMSTLPEQFFDLRYSTLDIDEALRVWVESLLPRFAATV